MYRSYLLLHLTTSIRMDIKHFMYPTIYDISRLYLIEVKLGRQAGRAYSHQPPSLSSPPPSPDSPPSLKNLLHSPGHLLLPLPPPLASPCPAPTPWASFTTFTSQQHKALCISSMETALCFYCQNEQT